MTSMHAERSLFAGTTEISLHALAIDGRLHILGLIQHRSEHRPPTSPPSPSSSHARTEPRMIDSERPRRLQVEQVRLRP
jgi:hypothetical protein